MRTGHPFLGTRGLRWIALVTALLGVLGTVAVALGTAPAERTFAAISGPAQSLMSLTVPFLGVLLVRELRRPARPTAVLAAIGWALGLAVLVAGFGVALSAAASSAASADRWEDAGLVALGSVLVQGTAQLVGTGLGLLVRRRVLACLATLVLPLGLWALLGALEVIRPAQDWLTPYPSAQRLLSGEMSPIAWVQWLVVLATWGAGLNALGTLRASRDGPGSK